MNWKEVYEDLGKELFWEALDKYIIESVLYNQDILDFISDTYAKCDNCGEWCLIDDMSTNDAITGGGSEHICEQCATDGYAS